MPRPLIPHGNRPRVPAGYEASYTGQSLKSAPHHSRPLPAQGRLGGAPTAESSALRPSPLQLTANQPNAPQKNMDQSEELARLRAELATLKMSISQQLPASTQTLEPTLLPKDAPANQSSNAPSSTGGLRGSMHAAATSSAPVQRTLSGGIPAGRGLGLFPASSHASLAATSPQITGPPHNGSFNRSVNVATRAPAQPRSNIPRDNNSLLGQGYQPPSKEKVAKRGAVKIVPATTSGATSRVAIESSSLKEVAYKRKQEAAEQMKEQESEREIAKKKAEDEVHRRRLEEEAAVAKADADVQRHEEATAKAAAEKAYAGEVANGLALSTQSGHGGHQSSKESGATGSSEQPFSPAAKMDFFVNPGRRICISNLPPGATREDIHEFIEKKANAGASIECIRIFARADGRLGHAFVDIVSSKDASHIVKWMNNEKLFEWPVNLRLARELNNVTIGELLSDSSGSSMAGAKGHSITDQPYGDVHSIQETTQPSAITCRYWLSGYCRDGADCRFAHSSDGGARHSQGHDTSRRGGSRRGKRVYNFENIPLPREDGDKEAGASLLGTSVYRPTALRIPGDRA